MDLTDPLYSEPYIQQLTNNDLYVIKSIEVPKNRRGNGIGSCILSQLPAVLQRITNDPHPVITVVPYIKGKQDDIAKAKKFFEKNNYKKVHACAQTLYSC